MSRQPSNRVKLTSQEIAEAFSSSGNAYIPPILSPTQLADLVGLSVKTIYEWIGKGRLDGTYRKRGKHCLIWRDRAIKLIFDGKDFT